MRITPPPSRRASALTLIFYLKLMTEGIEFLLQKNPKGL